MGPSCLSFMGALGWMGFGFSVFGFGCLSLFDTILNEKPLMAMTPQQEAFEFRCCYCLVLDRRILNHGYTGRIKGDYQKSGGSQRPSFQLDK